VLLVLATGCSRTAQTSAKKVIVLGIDGMDPGFVERHWANLPNLRRLSEKGSYTRLATTTPPQSPVAWSTFITGLSPAEHGIFDFVHRDPATLAPFLSMTRTEKPRHTLSVGDWRLPLSSARIVSLRKGVPFWKLLADAGIPVAMVRMPTNYPPVDAGRAIAGMGTPDLKGTQGTFTLFTNDPEELSRSLNGGRIERVQVENGRAVLRIEGPPNTFLKEGPPAAVDVVADIDEREPYARFAIEEHTVIVREGEWSEWLPANFPLLPHLVSARGMFRLFVRQLHPTMQVYVSPINVDPEHPVLPISAPPSYGRDVARSIGRFFTLGIAQDTSALRQGVFTLPQFLSQTRLVFDDESRLLNDALARFDGGLLFFYFSTLDENAHILWGQHEAELLNLYRLVDECIGEVGRKQPSAEVIVMSDHGFTTFSRAVNLNTWLYKRGFLVLNGTPGEGATIAAADWPSTEAYGLGLNGLYLNLAGREKHGSVPRSERSRALIESLREQLLAFRDPETGAQVVETVSPTNAAAANAATAPDLIVGYARGYRASWQTALGEIPPSEIMPNDDAWIADHCINAEDVPGVLFTSRKISAGRRAIQDVTVSILELFGVAPASGMSGRSIYR
jgi:predicted AlkP superfamily phosphohydrolase/phosphomutase